MTEQKAHVVISTILELSSKIDRVKLNKEKFNLILDSKTPLSQGSVFVPQEDYSISGQVITFIGNATGDLQIIQWAQNNLSQPNGTPVNYDINTVVGQATYSFSYDPNAFNLYDNGCLLLETVDYSVTTGSYTLAQTPTTNIALLVQQTFQRTGAA